MRPFSGTSAAISCWGFAPRRDVQGAASPPPGYPQNAPGALKWHNLPDYSINCDGVLSDLLNCFSFSVLVGPLTDELPKGAK